MKYIIPEHIQNLINEFVQSDINKIFKVGNFVTFSVKSGDTNFPVKLQVINSPIDMGDKPINNVFFLKNLSNYPIDIKNNYFMVNKPNQDIKSKKFEFIIIGKDENGKFKTIPNKKYTFKNISKVDLYDASNKLINTYYSGENKTSDENEITEKENNFINLVNDLDKGDSLILTLLDNTNIILNFINKNNSIIQFDVASSTSNYNDLLNVSSLEFNNTERNIIQNTENNTLSLNLEIFKNVNGDLVGSDLVINDIEDFSVGDASIIPIDDEEYYGEKSSEEAKKMMQAILNDPIMKKAFYSEPSLWNTIVSAIKGEKPRGTGIKPAKEILSKYQENKQEKKLGPQGDNFKRDKLAQFEVLNNNIVIKSSGVSTEDLVLRTNTKYDALVNPYKVGDEYLTLSNKRLKYNINVLRPHKDITDGFDVKIIKYVKSKTTGEISEFSKNGIIKFFNVRNSGYSKSDPIKSNKEQEPNN